jgi:phenylacetate-coenzyme A ligase PaaK-like adenylate-forming protein
MKKYNQKLNHLFKRDLYSMKNKERFFFKAMFDLTKLHYLNCKSYKKILDGLAYKFKNKFYLSELPYLPIRVFKNNKLLSVAKKNIIKILRSSGTTGISTSKIYLDRINSYNQIKTLNKIVKSTLGNDRLPMLIIDKKFSLNNDNEINARIAAINGFGIFGKNHTYLLNDKEEINYKEFKTFIKKYGSSKFLIFGFTSVVYENLIRKFDIKKNHYNLSNGIILHGGGWKKLEQIKISNDKFKSILFKKFNIKNVVNYYGLIEQTGSIFLECSKCSRFVTSEFSNIIIRDKNLEVCKNNESGMIQTMSLLPTSYPGHNILTEDIGEIKDQDNCPCGKKGKYFLVHGRIKEAEVRGCSNVR